MDEAVLQLSHVPWALGVFLTFVTSTVAVNPFVICFHLTVSPFAGFNPTDGVTELHVYKHMLSDAADAVGSGGGQSQEWPDTNHMATDLSHTPQWGTEEQGQHALKR